MDAWDQAKLDSLSPELKAKYDRRQRKGDVIEVREDGFWDNGFDKEAFVLVKIPGLALDNDLMAQLQDANHNLVKRRKWNVNRAHIPQAALDTLDGSDHVVTVTVNQLNNFLERKTNG